MIQFNFPNFISFARLLISPVIYFLFISNKAELVNLACWLFIISAITDTIDGWAARRFGEVTRSGEFLDPLADKALTNFALVAFAQNNIIPWWMVIIIITRDLISTLLRIFGLASKNPVKTSISAKIKTTVEMVFISYILLLIYIRNTFTSISPETVEKLIFSPITYILALIITAMALYSMGGYVIKFGIFSKKIKKY
jgi:CDP-diacylglycerol--glycerol-3-phosphate 3-phosphatidyltransferase